MDYDWNNIQIYINNLPNFIKDTIKQSEININKLLLYDCVKDKQNFLRVLENDTIQINKIYSVMNLLEFLFNDKIIYDCIEKLKSYNEKIKTNGNFIKKLLYFNKINNNSIEPYQKKFINNIIEQLNYNKIGVYDKIFIDGIEINTNFKINIYNLNNIILILPKNERICVINKYNKNICNVLINNIINKFNESVYYYMDNYFMYKNKFSNKSINNLKKFIDKLIIKINEQISKKKIINHYDYDDIVVYENNFNFYNISLKFFLDKMITFFNRKFNIQLKISENQNKWSRDVIIMDVYKNNIYIGILYLDLIANTNNIKPNVPLFININNRHHNKIFNFNENGCSCVLGSYNTLNNKELTYHYAQKLFIEFMLAIYNLFVNNNLGFSNIGIENKNIIEILAEKIFQSEYFIKFLYGNDFMDNDKLENLQLIKLIKFRYLCIDALFDIALYTNKNTSNLNSDSIIKIYNNIINKYSIDNFPYSNLNPLLLHKINGDFGSKYYHIVFNEIICHTITDAIIKNNIGDVLFDSLNNNKYDFKTNLCSFLHKNNLINKNIKFIIKNYNNDNDEDDIVSDVNNYIED